MTESIGKIQQCSCQELQTSVAEEIISALIYKKGAQEITLYALNHPSGNDDEALFILFCPFCGQPAGDGLAIRQELWANN